MQNAIRVLKELAAVNLQYAMADIEISGDKESMTHALTHVREVEACLQIILIEMSDHGEEPAAIDA
jgi:hypothetical protein